MTCSLAGQVTQWGCKRHVQSAGEGNDMQVDRVIWYTFSLSLSLYLSYSFFSHFVSLCLSYSDACGRATGFSIVFKVTANN